MIAEPFFTRTGSRLADLVSQLLEPHEREVVQGDLLESRESAWQSLLGILGLVHTAGSGAMEFFNLNGMRRC